MHEGIRQLLILDAYMDESGTHNTSRVVVVAGWLATAEQWKRFTLQWAETLDKWKIPFFHMTDFAASQSYYAEWSPEQKDTRIKHLISIINENLQGSVARIFAKDPMIVHWESGKQQMFDKVGDMTYVQAAQGCLIEAAEMTYRLYGDTPVRIAYIYETGAQRSGQLFCTFKAINSQPEMKAKYRTGSLDFGDKEGFPPLQAADILAYELYQEEGRKLIAEENGVPREYPKRRSLKALEHLPHAWMFMGGTAREYVDT